MFYAATITRSRDRFLRWVSQPRGVAKIWLGPHSVLAAWLGLFLAVITPAHGLGISLCWFQSCTGLPCPGCGMTRSLSCGLRGMFSESWQYHPLGLFVLGLFIFTAVQSLLPRRIRNQLFGYMETRAAFFNGLYVTFVIVFVGFGLMRALFHLGGVWERYL